MTRNILQPEGSEPLEIAMERGSGGGLSDYVKHRLSFGHERNLGIRTEMWC